VEPIACRSASDFSLINNTILEESVKKVIINEEK
jgi:hypothetical protein